MKKSISGLLLIFVMLAQGATAQYSKKEIKAMTKADGYAKKGDYEKAIKTFDPVLTLHENDADLWDKMIEYYYGNYSIQKELNFTISVSAKEGDSVSESSQDLVKQLAELLDPRKNYYNKFLDKCKEATRKCEYPNYPPIYLRSEYYDFNSDTAVNEEAKRCYNRAEKNFREKNYRDAIDNYTQALKITPNYYKAKVYLGDTYYAMKDYTNAVSSYREAISWQPDLLEARKFLVDALWGMGSRDEARKECINALLIYPDQSMFYRLMRLSEATGYDFNRRWIARDCEPHEMRTEGKAKPGDSKEDYKGTKWYFYLEAKEKVEQYCDKNGIIRTDNPVTKQRYLEVYCWEYMLQNSEDSSLTYARQMYNENKLDCYVLLSVFNAELLAQFKDLKKNNTPKMRTYLEGLLRKY